MPSQSLLKQEHSIHNEIESILPGICDNVVLLIIDLHHKKIVYICETVESLFGYSQTLVLDKGYEFINSIIQPQDSSVLLNIYQEIFQSKGGKKPKSWSQVFRIRNASGDWIMVSGNFTLRDHNPQGADQLYISIKALSSTKKDILVSQRELEILRLVAQGFSNKQIAHQLFISVHTAITHRKNLIEKFEVKNTAELIKEAAYRQWLD